MTWFGVFILSLVEGVTEFLPVSSTGHMILAAHLWKFTHSSFLKSFEIIIQLGAILAVLVTYWETLWKRRDYWPKIIAALIPTLVIGYFLYPVVKNVFLGNVVITLVGLLLGAIGIIVVEKWYARKPQLGSLNSLTWKQAVIIGFAQALAIVPGFSRSAVTVLTGMVLGQSRKSALDFSFLLALPVMSAAAGYDILESGYTFTREEWFKLGVGFGIAFLVALISIKWLIVFVQKKSLLPFAWYRIGLVAVFTILLVLFR